MGSGKWIGVLLVTLNAACGGHSVREPPGGAAGTSSNVDPPQPTPTDPGPGDNPTPIDDPEPNDPLPPEVNTPRPLPVPCEYESLDAICSSTDCATSPDSLAERCTEGVEVSRGSTACGGTVAIVSFTFGQTSWFFDASGELTGVISESDVIEVCPDGHHSSARVYGDVCQALGDLADVCVTSTECGPIYMCNPGPNCPLHSADVLSSYCYEAGTVFVSASETTCGGHMATVENANGVVRYCYDSQDWLTGIAAQQADSSWSSLGTDCRIQGARRYPCVTK